MDLQSMPPTNGGMEVIGGQAMALAGTGPPFGIGTISVFKEFL